VKSPCHCHTDVCRSGPLERPRFFPGQLVGADELNLQQEYFRNRLRLRNRMLHGWGVVCGALVCLAPKKRPTNVSQAGADLCRTERRSKQTPESQGAKEQPDPWKPWTVRVQPGFILGPYGDEILIDRDYEIDLRIPCTTGSPGEPPEQAVDPWCSTVRVEPKQGGDLFVVVRYKEVATRPVRVQPSGCGCDHLTCEDSRWRDCFEICVLDHCPHDEDKRDVSQEMPEDERYRSAPPWFRSVFHSEHCEPNTACPPCPTEPWVGLAKVTLGECGRVEKIDNCACRRIVALFGNFWWNCCLPDNGDETCREEEETQQEAESGAGEPEGGPTRPGRRPRRGPVKAPKPKRRLK
jgi:hypothetical protein